MELIVAEVGKGPEDDQIYRLTPDGSVVDEQNSVVVGGNADSIGNYLGQRHQVGMSLAEALKVAVESLARDPNGGSPRTLTPEQLEVAVLDRRRPQQRKFKRILGAQLSRLLSGDATAGADADADVDAESTTTAAGSATDSATEESGSTE